MTKSVLDQLQHADASLTRACVANLVCGAALFVLTSVAVATGSRDASAVSVSQMLIGLVQVGC